MNNQDISVIDAYDHLPLQDIEKILNLYINTLSTSKFLKDSNNPEQLLDCAICLTLFVDQEEILTLECDPRH